MCWFCEKKLLVWPKYIDSMASSRKVWTTHEMVMDREGLHF